ncbi:LpqB family beta-propeller domain-containing protein [Streptomyces sp. NBC_01619]|uniref:LpqB family beta-propeller domain-containing protein n=1 Tax=Streptomyces pratisoli TaxID=3139917 RepID=A0ACC6QGL7_9ACTN|nr:MULTISPECIES: LpqB family beta-propeller domain-containing protein [unclassified Streptomyces]MCX4508717.1 LpqB family beta-propeller domain-containing protein [Streptomyces sp. NBC_01619]
MGAERRRYGHGRATRGWAVFACSGVLLAGCASMPDSGDVEQVKATKGADSQVRVYAVPPRDGARPDEIVDGFLEAMTSDDPSFATARKYLTKQESKEWRPDSLTTVLTEAPESEAPASEARSGEEADSLTYALSGELIATVDRHAYKSVVPTQYGGSLRLVRQSGPDGKGKEWRIASAPRGLVLGESDFLRNYLPVNKYYWASGQNTVVADPVYIRQRQDPVTRMDPVAQTVSALFEGPARWLTPVVDSPFPTGAGLKKGVTSLTPDDQNVLKVPLNDKASNVGGAVCKRMATQLLLTLRDLASPRVEQVELQRSDRSPLCVLTSDQADAYALERPSSDNVYFVDRDSRMAVVGASKAKSVDTSMVRGPFGNGQLKVGTVAVARSLHRAASVSQDGKSLYVASIVSDEALPDPLVQSGAPLVKDRLSAPSWDRNDLWVADRDPAKPRLLRFADGQGEAQEVKVDGLDGARIESMRVSADGVRMALLLSKDGKNTLKIGRIERRAEAGGELTVSVVDLQAAAPRLETVTALSWAGPSRLVVVGKEAGGVQQVRYIETDGSLTPAGGLPGLNKVSAVAATEDEEQYLVAVSDDGLVRLVPNANWQTMIEKGSSPVYPG